MWFSILFQVGRENILICECDDEPLHNCDGEAHWVVLVQVVVEQFGKDRATVACYRVS